MTKQPLGSDARGRTGELTFETLCVKAGLIANQSTWDRTGWDYLVEFPFPESDVPLDSQPGPPEARVQVKTVREKTPSVRMRLSAAARLARHPQAAFICVLVLDGAQKPREMYVLHVLDDLLSRILKELRKCQAANSLQINHEYLNLPIAQFGTKINVAADELRHQFETCAGANPYDYAATKRDQTANLGFNVYRYSGNLTLAAESDAEIADIMLGIKPGKLSNFEVNEVRWDIPLPAPGSNTSGLIKVSPASRPGEFIVHGKTGKQRLKVNVSFPAAIIPGSRRMRLASDELEAVVDINAGTIDLSTGVPDDRGLTTQQLIRLTRFQRFVMEGGKFEIRIENKRLGEGQKFSPGQFSGTPEQLTYTNHVLQRLDKIISAADAQEALIAISDINRQMLLVDLVSRIMFEADRVKSVSFKLTAAADAVLDIKGSDILVLVYLHFRDTCIAFAATGITSLSGEGSQRSVEVSDFHAREVEAIEKSADAMTDFRKAMQAETGIELAIYLTPKDTAP